MDSKKKIFFLLYSMHVGGVEKSLVNLLTVIPRDKYDIHVGLVHPEGDLLSLLPSDVTIHSITDISKCWQALKASIFAIMGEHLRNGQWASAFWIFISYLICKLQSSYLWWTNYLLKDSYGLEDYFDIAVAYAGPAIDIDYYVCNIIKADKKVGWVHFDISKIGIDKKAIKKLYSQYSRIFVVSEQARGIFVRMFPEFEDKVKVFHNVVSPIQIMRQALAGETFADNFEGSRILTVGRMSSEKGQRIAIQALKILVDKGICLRWYFIGDGAEMEKCKSDVCCLGLFDHVKFLGMKTNPYAYMRDCDVYMQPSRHEGFCITLAEALCFDHPIVATDFTGAREQLIGRKNGIVVGMDAKDIAIGIELALSL